MLFQCSRERRTQVDVEVSVLESRLVAGYQLANIVCHGRMWELEGKGQE